MTKQHSDRFLCLLALLPFVAVAFLYELLPLLMLLVNSFRPEGGGPGFTLEHYIAVFTGPLYRKAVRNSAVISLISSAAGLLAALLGGMAAHRAGRGSRLYNAYFAVLNVTSNFAGVPLAFAFMILLGNSGILKRWFFVLEGFDLYTAAGLRLIYIYFQIPLATLLMLPAFDGVRREWQEAAALMGCSAAGFWARVGLPVLLPSILGTAGVLFANALAAYATAYALLMNNFALLPVSISGMFVGDVTLRTELGGALSVVMLLMMTAAVGINHAIACRLRKGGSGR